MGSFHANTCNPLLINFYEIPEDKGQYAVVIIRITVMIIDSPICMKVQKINDNMQV